MAITDLVPEDTSQQIKDFEESARQPASAIERQYSEGADRMPGFLTPSKDFSTYQGEGIADNKTLLDAINQKAMGGYRAEMAGLKSDIEAKALESRMTRLQNAKRMVFAEHQENERARMNARLQEANRRRARAAVLGNVLGIAGAVVGGMTGGPAGAAAGYQVGQGLGNASGGTDGY